MNKLAIIEKIYKQSINQLLYEAHTVHKKYHKNDTIQKSTLLSIKTGGCSEDCKYCAQSKFYHTDVKASPMLNATTILAEAHKAKAKGASRFCMGSVGSRVLDNKNFDTILHCIKAIKNLKLETCATLGMLNKAQALKLKQAGLDYYNHNLDTSREYYSSIVTTRTYQDRLDTLSCVRSCGIKVCTGGILGMGESQSDRISLLLELINLKPQPESVTINTLSPIKGTPLEKIEPLNPIELVRTIATARIFIKKSTIRLSAGREKMSATPSMLMFLRRR